MANETLQQQAIMDALGEFITLEARIARIEGMVAKMDKSVLSNLDILQKWANQVAELEQTHIAALTKKSDAIERSSAGLVKHGQKVVLVTMDAIAKEQSEKRLSALATVAAKEALVQIRPEVVASGAVEISKIKTVAGEVEARILRTVEAAIKKIVWRGTLTIAGTGAAMVLVYAFATYFLPH